MNALLPEAGCTMKILLAVDGSAHTRRMLGYVTTHDEMFGMDNQYAVVTVVPLVGPRAAAFMSAESLTQLYGEQADEVLWPVKRFIAQKGWQAEYLHRRGSAGDAIAELASEGNYDLVVMGSHGHSSLTNVVMGSVATRVLAKCRTPVLLIR
jgi:nucleotide-binding universal stress UspA family protein